jgi:hypothetical protein
VADNCTSMHLINPGFQHIRFEGSLTIHLRCRINALPFFYGFQLFCFLFDCLLNILDRLVSFLSGLLHGSLISTGNKTN